MRLYLTISVLLISAFTLYGQGSMNEGFHLLDSGNFAGAEEFFDAYLREAPENKTALICYGRAVGLNGNPTKAISHFEALKEQYPGDLEVDLNFNEAFLWDGQFERARPLYESLVNIYPESFASVLGYANTLSNLKEYPMALRWIEKAIALDSANTSARLSIKYIRLGYADSLIKKKEYSRAEELLKENFIDFPSDRETLISLANLYLIKKETDKARQSFLSVATTAPDSVRALNGLSLVAHLDRNEKQALRYAEEGLSKSRVITDVVLGHRTRERYIQALIWNGRYTRAGYQIDSLEQVLPEESWVKALRATLGMYTGKFDKAISEYRQILATDSTSFDGNLGNANALFASDRPLNAYRAAFRTLTYYPGQADAQALLEKINEKYIASVEEKPFYAFDNGNNIAYGNQVSLQLPFSTKFRTQLSYLYRETENTLSGNRALSHVVLAGLTYTLMPNTRVKANAGFNISQSEAGGYTQPVVDLRFQFKPFRLQNAELGYRREVQSFNADLIEREIVMNHLGLNYNLSTTMGLGWYTQVMHTAQTYGNSRNLIFTSLYYNLLKTPAVKTGINFQYISFAEQLPQLYFSPEKYQAVEVFGEFNGSLSEMTNFRFNGAFGLQQVEDDPQSAVFRLEAGIKHRFSKRLGAELYGKYSNIASATAAGFEFTEIGIAFRWNLKEVPLYYKKMLARL